MRRTNGSDRRSEQQKRHRAAALQNLAEMMMLWNSRKHRGVRQPCATLGACPFAGGIPKCTRKFIGSRNPPPYVAGYVSLAASASGLFGKLELGFRCILKQCFEVRI